MKTYTPYIDNKIKNTFRLFDGKRSEEEDNEIYEKVTDLCFNEVIAFLEDNLDKDSQESLTKNLDKKSSRTQILLRYLQEIPNYRFKLDKRLDYFLNNLLYSALKDK